MIKVTCDRCKKQIENLFEYPILTITSRTSDQEKPWMIDLCQDCKVKFYEWFDADEKRM